MDVLAYLVDVILFHVLAAHCHETVCHRKGGCYKGFKGLVFVIALSFVLIPANLPRYLFIYLFFCCLMAMQGKQGLSTDNLVFLLAKQLSPSGVSSLGRIVLPKVLKML